MKPGGFSCSSLRGYHSAASTERSMFTTHSAIFKVTVTGILLICLHLTAWVIWRYNSHGRRTAGRTGRKLIFNPCRHSKSSFGKSLLWPTVNSVLRDALQIQWQKLILQITDFVDEVQHQAIKDSYSIFFSQLLKILTRNIRQ